MQLALALALTLARARNPTPTQPQPYQVIIVQRIVQRHVKLLLMRGESKVHFVLDLAQQPELLQDGPVAYATRAEGGAAASTSTSCGPPPHVLNVPILPKSERECSL